MSSAVWTLTILLLAACAPKHAGSWSSASSNDQAAGARVDPHELEAAIASGQGVDAILVANRLEASGQSIDATRRQTVLQLVDTQSMADLEALSSRLDAAYFPASAVAYRRVVALAHMGNGVAARAALVGIVDPGLRTRARALVRDSDVQSNVVAVLLPLSGRYQKIGQEVRAAVELAANKRTAFKLVFVDTKGDAKIAALAVDTVVKRDRPLWILGPVGKLESRAAARRAAIHGVPMALLSPAAGLEASEAGIVRLVSSARDRARAAARAALALGFAAPATMVPRSPEGRAQATAFADTMQKAGVTLVRAGTYDPTGSELEQDMRWFLELVPQRNARLRKHLRRRGKSGWKTFSPDVPFDVLFIPDRVDRAVLVASYLRYFNVELRDGRDADVYALRRKHGGRLPTRVQLIGGSGWHRAALLTQDPADIEGALIIDVTSGSDEEEYPTVLAAGFADKFLALTGREPSPLAVETYDAARLAFAAHERAQVHNPSHKTMAHALRRAQLARGTTGPMHVDAMGRLSRRFVLLKVENEAFVLQDLIR